MKHWLTRPNALRWILGAALAVLLLNAVVGPRLADWRDAADRCRLAAESLTRSGERAGRSAQRRDRLTLEFGPSLRQRLTPLSSAGIEFYQTVEAALTASGLRVASIRPHRAQVMTGARGLSILALRVEGSGSLAEMSDLLARIRDSERPILVEEAELRKPAGRPEGSGLEFTLLLGTVVEGVEKGAAP